MKKKSYTGYSPYWPIISVIPAVVAILIFSLFPAIVNIVISFTDYSGNLSVPFKFVGLKNYIIFFTLNGRDSAQSLKITLQFSIAVVLIQQAFSLLMALLVNMKLRLSNFYRAIFFMPSILGVVVIGLIWNLMFDPYSGLFAYILGLFGESSAFLGDMNLALPLVIFVTIWANFGYSMAIYLAGLQAVPEEYYEAADIDGASNWNKLRHITIPLIRPSMTINFWISISGTIGMYDIMFILTGGGPANATRTFSLYFFNQLTLATNKGQVAAMSIYFFILTSIIMLSFNYFFRRKEVEM